MSTPFVYTEAGSEVKAIKWAWRKCREGIRETQRLRSNGILSHGRCWITCKTHNCSNSTTFGAGRCSFVTYWVLTLNSLGVYTVRHRDRDRDRLKTACVELCGGVYIAQRQRPMQKFHWVLYTFYRYLYRSRPWCWAV